MQLRRAFIVTFVACVVVAKASAEDDAAAAVAVGNNSTGNPEVSTFLGRVKGSFMTSRLGKKIYAFRGIRYGEAPIGERRFKSPEPAKSWNDVFDASQEGPSCPRPSGRIMTEDCLRLNVYSTKLPATASAANEAEGTKKPVMVFFHPGGFYGFSGQSYLFGPDYILDQDIVLITVNYRLGALGFLSTGDAEAPGNYGLKDQVLALKWIQENIQAFGGDPNSVTISGYSSGSWSVALHLTSPMSKGLFHKAITMSGSPTKARLLYNQMDYAKKLARIFNCPDDNSTNIVTCLRTKDAIEMAKSVSQFEEWHWDPIRIWTPVVEPNVSGLDRFIVQQPMDLIKRGRIHDVPLLAGVNRDEFKSLTSLAVFEAMKGNDSIFRDMDANWTRIAPISFMYERDTPRSREISKKVRDFYFQGKSVNLESYEQLGKAYADLITGFPMHRLVNLVSSVSKKPVYYYRFVYQGRYSFRTWFDTNKPYGVVHHDDLLYLFYISLYPYFEADAPEIPMVERMTAMWANFAKTGEPIPKNNKNFEGITWEEFTPQNNRYMEINTTLTMKTGLNRDRMQFIEREIFPCGCYPTHKHH